jgi:hypothetical protein
MSERFIQSLENRQLFAAEGIQLSAAPMTRPYAWVAATDFAQTPAGKFAAALKAGGGSVDKPGQTPDVSGPPTVRSTDLKGDWSGEIEVDILFFEKDFDAELHITGQTETTLTGTIEIDGHDFSGTFNGHINPTTGRFTWKVEDDGDSVELVGRLNAKGTKMVGEIEGDYDGFDADGDFEFVKRKQG